MSRNQDQNQSRRPSTFKPLAGGLILGALTAGSLVTGLLEMKARQEERQASNFFEWPAIAVTKERSR